LCIALGAASLLGIDLVENFNLPYLARTVTEFCAGGTYRFPTG
jgi:D-alanyl-lipoteichoic acid acyltransferase DltB (MBOAT superfamily)